MVTVVTGNLIRLVTGWFGVTPCLQRVEKRLGLCGLGRVPRRRSLAIRIQRAAQ